MNEDDDKAPTWFVNIGAALFLVFMAVVMFTLGVALVQVLM